MRLSICYQKAQVFFKNDNLQILGLVPVLTAQTWVVQMTSLIYFQKSAWTNVLFVLFLLTNPWST